MPRRHYKSRFLFFKYQQLKDEFHTDTFFLSVRSAQNYTCAQIFTGKGTGYWEVYPMNKESHSLRSLQDFVRNVSIPPTLKRDNTKTQAGERWMGFKSQMCINGLIMEPHSP